MTQKNDCLNVKSLVCPMLQNRVAELELQGVGGFWVELESDS